jgi:hypothetical protein
MVRRGALLLLIAACGADAPPPVAAPIADLAGDLVDPGAGGDDAIVARVDGRPVWASCVAGHVRARGVSVDDALADCIDLELLAAEAVRRRIADDPEHQAALRTALVDQFVAEGFEDAYRAPADLPKAAVDEYVRLRAADLDRPEVRTMVYFRAPVARTAAAGSPEDLAAKAFAEEVYAPLAGRDDLFYWDLKLTAERVANGRPYEYAVPRPGGLVPEFGAAAYAVPGVGQVSPPTRTPWGWDLILIVEVVPALHQTPEQLIAGNVQPLLRWYFDAAWMKGIAANHAIEVFADRLGAPDEDPREPPAPGPGVPGPS